jgi:hypothetical protein
VDGIGIVKPDFALGRMHVDINLGWIQIHKQHQHRKCSGRNQISISHSDGMSQDSISYHPTIDIQMQEVAIAPLFVRKGSESTDPDAFHFIVEWNQVVEKRGPKDLIDSFALLFHRCDRDELTTPVYELKLDLRISQSVTRNLPTDMTEFRGDCFQELLPGGNIEKEVFDNQFSTFDPADFSDRLEFTSLIDDLRPFSRALINGLQSGLGDRSDGW